MTIQLTAEQWADVQKEAESPPRFSDPSQSASFVLLRADTYERFKALFEEDPVTDRERLAHLQQFGRRAGWDDPEMNVYDDLDPRSVSRP